MYEVYQHPASHFHDSIHEHQTPHPRCQLGNYMATLRGPFGSVLPENIEKIFKI